MEWEIRLPIRRPLTLNEQRRQHWAVKRREIAQLRGDALLLFRSLRIPRHQQVSVHLTYFPPDRRTRDADNLVATLKPVCDALKDAGVVSDDSPEFMVKYMPIICSPDGDPRVIVRVTGIRPAEPEPAVTSRNATRR